MNKAELFNLTEKDFHSERSKRIEALAIVIKAKCEALPHILSMSQASAANYYVESTKADEWHQSIRQLHEELIRELLQGFFSPAVVPDL